MNERNRNYDGIYPAGPVFKAVGLYRYRRAAKFFLQEKKVVINGEPDNRRGRKLYRRSS